MGNKMLIDAAHPEETRVVVLRGNRIEEFDFEAADKKQLRGNIYLAKVTRVEPSLQAAFIEYGGNRHGFLAFSEIHPDYYQIPVADRQQLLEDEARSAEDDEEEPRGGQGSGHRRSRRHRRGGGSAEKRTPHSDETVTSEDKAALGVSDLHEPPETGEATEPAEAAPDEAPAARADRDEAALEPLAESPPTAMDEPAPELDAAEESDTSAEEGERALEALEPMHEPEALQEGDGLSEADHEADGGEHPDDEGVEQLGGDALEDVPHRVSRPRRNYKIQEVIKRRQVLLVQVVKEERGNKGAALTTYLSLAGRYSVLMPNTARGGGISRKIVDPEDRKRLKAIAQELEVPDGMGIILRTAGAARGMPEVKRDFEYLLRMWETVRETTLQSSAPMLVYEEGSLIKRSIRDLFTKDVDEVVVAGEEAYREAKDFMRLLMPGQVRNVVAWRDPQPIFAKAGAEAQLDAMFSNQVVLKSGGYLVINQTEALVAIDVNSGRSTREHNIEDTALRTNLEAADEVARQLRLRDLAGLIVVDFIDMEEGRNDRAVERRLKDALKNDRARIQIGRISHFGLLEMSRQRMRTGVLEGSTVMCAHCAGSGTVRSVSSMALHVLRLLEDALIRSAAYNLIGRTRAEVAIYILNQKRANLLDLESRFGIAITILADPAMTGMVYHAIERGGEATPVQRPAFRPGASEVPLAEDDVEEEIEEGGEDLEESGEDEGPIVAGEERRPASAEQGEGGRRKRRRRRRRGGGREDQMGDHRGAPSAEADAAASGISPEVGEEAVPAIDQMTDIESGFLDPSDAPQLPAEPTESVEPASVVVMPAAAEALTPEPAVSEEAEAVEAPRRRRSPRRGTRAAAALEAASAEIEAAPAETDATAELPAPPARRPRRSRRTAEVPATAETPATDAEEGAAVASPALSIAEPELPLVAAAAPVEPVPPQDDEDPDRPKRSGWWQRAKATFSAGS